MSPFFYLFLGLIALVVTLFVWAVRAPGRGAAASSLPALAGVLEACERKHATYFPQIQQAFAKTDDEFLRQNGSRELARRVRRERLGAGLTYLKWLRTDFQNLLRLARIVAVLSPRVAALQEWERLRLTAEFALRYQIIRIELIAGFAPLPQLSGLANVVSGMHVRMESTINELGERAAMATEFASALDGRGVDPL